MQTRTWIGGMVTEWSGGIGLGGKNGRARAIWYRLGHGRGDGLGLRLGDAIVFRLVHCGLGGVLAVVSLWLARRPRGASPALDLDLASYHGVVVLPGARHHGPACIRRGLDARIALGLLLLVAGAVRHLGLGFLLALLLPGAPPRALLHDVAVLVGILVVGRARGLGLRGGAHIVDVLRATGDAGERRPQRAVPCRKGMWFSVSARSAEGDIGGGVVMLSSVW